MLAKKLISNKNLSTTCIDVRAADGGAGGYGVAPAIRLEPGCFPEGNQPIRGEATDVPGSDSYASLWHFAPWNLLRTSTFLPQNTADKRAVVPVNPIPMSRSTIRSPSL